MYDPEAEKAVDELRKSDGATSLSKSQQYERIKRFAVRQKLSPAESDQQAMTRYITKDSTGQALYQSYVATKGASVPAPEPAVAGNRETAALTRLRALAATLKMENPELSPQQALHKALQTDAGRDAYNEDKRARLRVG